MARAWRIVADGEVEVRTAGLEADTIFPVRLPAVNGKSVFAIQTTRVRKVVDTSLEAMVRLPLHTYIPVAVCGTGSGVEPDTRRLTPTLISVRAVRVVVGVGGRKRRDGYHHGEEDV
jgi:hypothetical protein